ncbi:hypothetical protein [Aquisalimonas sp.]|uniref:hypothetical protein n=1 Tax=Aquisalimonas sp. TaxID=1872621 RepID=UPI0025BF92BB|nr:hypothetical protein [Aquisalimonas sp.]
MHKHFSDGMAFVDTFEIGTRFDGKHHSDAPKFTVVAGDGVPAVSPPRSPGGGLERQLPII